ncbi:major facilitator superfamily domain-containing protein [Mycena polygramma]|nr:major facilitator superfamily domain-containing protein [Mycena polygramma]
MSADRQISVDESGDMELTRRLPLEVPPPASATLDDLDADRGDTENTENGTESALPPTDGGRGAWSFVAPRIRIVDAYGVFLDSYLQDPRYATQKSATSLLPLIGTLSSGIVYCSGSILNPIAARYPHHRSKAMWLGAVLCCGTLFGASYTTDVRLQSDSCLPSHRTILLQLYQHILLQGVFYAIGGSLLYLPCISYLSEWFVVRRGLANGILFAGTAAGGLVLPLVLAPLISNHGSAKALRILAIAIAVLLFPLLPFVKGRIPDTRARVHGPTPRGAPGPQEWMKHKLFWLVLAVNTLQGFAYFVPIIYLPTFANDLNISSSNSAATLAMLNAAAVVGRLSMGYLSDRVNAWKLALATLFTTSLATFILWGVLSHSFAGLMIFGIAYGSIAGGWTGLWTGFVRPLAKDDPVLSTTLFGYLLLSRGIGNIVSTPISAQLYARPLNVTHIAENTGFGVGAGRFENMIIYVGTCFAGAAGVAAIGWAVDARKGRRSARSGDLE